MILAIDGGGTKTDLGIFDLEGHILYRTIGPGCSHQSLGIHTYEEVINMLLDEALAALSITKEDLSYAHLGLTGADTIDDFDKLTRATKHLLGHVPFTIENDAWLILRSGLKEPHGAVCISGTGTNAAAIHKNGQSAILRSLGFILGIYGGGLDIAREALHFAFRDDEMSYKPTRLSEEIPKLFHLDSMETMVPLLYPKNVLSREQLGMITGLVFDLADQHDEVCQEILDKIATYLGHQTAGVIKQIHAENEAFPVVIGGRVFKDGNQRFKDQMLAILQTEVPKAYLITPKYSPMVGAYLRALDHLKIEQTKTIENNLKESGAL